MDEGVAFQRRYQEQGLRSTEDLAITVLQGSGVGGSTTINWTSCFRTPERILDIWRERFGVSSISREVLDPFWTGWTTPQRSPMAWRSLSTPTTKCFLEVESGWESTLRRNVKGCMDSGYCGWDVPPMPNKECCWPISMLWTRLRCSPTPQHNAWKLRTIQWSQFMPVWRQTLPFDLKSVFPVVVPSTVTLFYALISMTMVALGNVHSCTQSSVWLLYLIPPSRLVGLHNLCHLINYRAWWGQDWLLSKAMTHPIIAATAATNFGMGQQSSWGNSLTPPFSCTTSGWAVAGRRGGTVIG